MLMIIFNYRLQSAQFVCYFNKFAQVNLLFKLKEKKKKKKKQRKKEEEESRLMADYVDHIK